MTRLFHEYDVGDQIRIVGGFRDVLAGDAYIDPTTVTLTIKPPTGPNIFETYNPGAIVRDSIGLYHYDMVIPAIPGGAGLWYFRWLSTGVGAAAENGVFRVRESEVS